MSDDAGPEPSADDWFERGHALIRRGEPVAAAAAFRESLVQGETARARHHLGQALYRLGALDEAVRHLRTAAETHGLLAAWLGLATIIPGAPGATQADILAARRGLAEHLARTPMAAQPPTATARTRKPGERVKLGYVSAWFTAANYMKPVWALVNHHDRTRFEIHLFSDAPVNAGLAGYEPATGDRLYATGDLDNSGLARCIAEAGIDVLIDLNGYSTPDRLGLFVASPAPVCLAWFNMYATSGLPGLHYLVGDAEVVTGEDERWFTEQVLRLPLSYLSFTVSHSAPPVVDPPCLRQEYLTFGSLVTQYKITPGVIDSWARILRRAPRSRLLLANRALDSTDTRDWLAARFHERGVGRERIEFRGSAPHHEYLGNYDAIDVALDAFPYNGGTTTMEALWQGVPVLTFDGGRWSSRTSQTLLRRTHLSHFARDDRASMEAFAVELATDPSAPERLGELRRNMRPRLEGSPVCDAAALAREMERLLETLVGTDPGA